jgi:hypothetical protein
MTANLPKIENVISSLLLAVGLAVGGYFISQTLYNSKVGLNIAEVKGLAEKRVQANVAYWLIEYTVTGENQSDVATLYKQSEADRERIITVLKETGFTDEEIAPGVLAYQKREFRNEQKQLINEKHILTGEIEVQTAQVSLVSKGRAQLNALIAQGVNIENNQPKYYFTQLNDIKLAMLREATQNARLAAKEFAEDAGVKVGGIHSARQGGFSIRDVGQEYGDTEKIEKDVRVVTNVSFFLID